MATKLDKTLTTLCHERGLSLTRLSRDADVPVSTLHAWTTGRTSVNPAQVRRVAQVLGVSLHGLLFGEPDPNREPADGGERLLEQAFTGEVVLTVRRPKGGL
jgi:transcriptional regulator with XRE-family HTH domain